MPSTPSLVVGEAFVKDSHGSTWVAINPGYASPSTTRYLLVSFGRSMLCTFSLSCFVYALVGQIIPFATYTNREHVTGPTALRVWDTWAGGEDGTHTVPYRQGSGADQAMRAVALLTLLLNAIAAALSVVLMCTWASDEVQRQREEKQNRLEVQDYLTQHHSKEDVGKAKTTVMTPYPAQKAGGNTKKIPVAVEVRELARRHFERKVALSLFALLIPATVFALVTMLLMVPYPSSAQEAHHHDVGAGTVCFICVFALDVLALCVVLVPAITHVHLFCAPPVPPCALMTVADDVASQCMRDVETPPSILLNPLKQPDSPQSPHREKSPSRRTARTVAAGASRPTTPLRVSFSDVLEVRTGEESAAELRRKESRALSDMLTTGTEVFRFNSTLQQGWTDDDTSSVNMDR